MKLSHNKPTTNRNFMATRVHLLLPLLSSSPASSFTATSSNRRIKLSYGTLCYAFTRHTTHPHNYNITPPQEAENAPLINQQTSTLCCCCCLDKILAQLVVSSWLVTSKHTFETWFVLLLLFTFT